jgi:hypothetical protein
MVYSHIEYTILYGILQGRNLLSFTKFSTRKRKAFWTLRKLSPRYYPRCSW